MLALLASLLPALKKGRRLDIPSAVLALCTIVFLFVGKWPSLSGPPSPPTLAVALHPQPITPNRIIEKGEWVDASKDAMQMNHLRVEILSVRVGAVNLVPPVQNKTGLKDKYLVIHLRVSYHGARFREIPYDRWADLANVPSKHKADLRDDGSQSYAQVVFDLPSKVAGRVEGELLTPGHMVREVLVYPPPSAGMQHLRLILPGSAFGVTGEFRFHIPRSMIEQS
jgi:hypothetical protein